MTGRERGNGEVPGVIVLPPVLYLVTLGIGLTAHYLRPVHPFPPLASRIVGVLLVAGALGVALWGEKAMHRAGTNVRPDRPTHAIVTGGPFRYSRNPLYVAATALYVGIACLANALWPLLLLVPLLLILNEGVVKREERYLEARFGEEYRSYRRRVRRWL